MKRLHLDWRGTPNLSTVADLYSVGATLESRPVTGNPSGRLLVGISPTILLTPASIPSPRPYNQALADAATRLGAFSFPAREVWRGDNGYSTVLFDLTRRGMLKAWLEILDAHFPWADGFHCDYASAWSWLFPDMAESDQQWDSLLGAMFNALRAKRKLVLAQQFHVTFPVMQSNGAFVEQSPFAFHYRLDDHVSDMSIWKHGLKVAHEEGRENIWTYEVREWQNWPKASLDLVKAWAEEQGCYVCLGRDGNVAP